MKIFGMARLGRDAEMRQTNDGTPVVNLALAFDYGKKGADGKRPTQWVEAAMYGKRAEALAPYLVKGGLHFYLLEDVHVATYPKQDGTTGYKLAARVIDVELVQRNTEAHDRPAPAVRPQPHPQRPALVAQGAGFDGLDDDIPF